MHVKIAGILLALLLLSGFACAQQPSPQPAQEQDLGAEVSMQELAPGVWLHRSTSVLGSFGRVESNGLVITGPRESVLIDTPATVPQTARILDWAERRGKPVRHAIYTHAHTDRIGGADAVLARGIKSYALPRTIEIAQRDGISLGAAPLPTDSALRLSGVTLQVFYPGPGHTEDNIVVWLPQSRTLFGGCFVKATSSTTLGNTAEADIQSWERGAGELLRRYKRARIVVPGHGPTGGPELLEHTLHLVEAALKSDRAFQAGGGL